MKYLYLMFLMLCSCQEYGAEEQANELFPLSVTAQIGSLSTLKEARYVGSQVDAISFGEGDAIGLFMGDEAALKWNYALDWSPESPVHWPDKTTKILFRAYYPYVAAETPEQIPMPSLLGQKGTVSGLSSCDFMVASTSQTCGEDGVVKFDGENSFKHVSCLVHLVLKEQEALAGATLDKISIKGAYILSPASYSFTTERVTLHPTSSNEDNLLEVAPGCAMNGASFYFILNEKSSDDEVTLTLDYTLGTKKYRATKTQFAHNHFVSGVQQEYNLIIQDDQVLISDASISGWGSGGTMEDIIIDGEEVKI